MFPDIHRSIREARAQLRTGHHDIRPYLSNMAATEPTTNATPTTPTAQNTTIVRNNS
jgi:hypothetical protein